MIKTRINNGITLIALVITIVVLIILAGVIITLALGENGLINRAKTSANNYKIEEYKEKIELKILELKTENTDPELSEIKTALESSNWDWVYSIEEITDNDEQKLKLTTMEGFIFHITTHGVELSQIGPKVETNPELSVSDISTTDLERKTDIPLSNIFIVKWGTKGTGTVTYNTQGTLSYNNSEFQSQSITNISELELGTYTITCTLNGIDRDGNDIQLQETKTVSITEIDQVGEDTFEVYSTSDFVALVSDVTSLDGKTVKLEGDVNLNEGKYSVVNGVLTFASDATQWEPIGSPSHAFNGEFDGQGHKIEGVYINDSSKSDQGLFGVVASTGKIKNVVLDNSSVRGDARVGTLTGRNSGIIEDCSSQNSVVVGSKQGCGGLVGANNQGATIRRCFNSSKVTSAYYEVGGLVGYNYGTIEECYNSGHVKNTHVTIGGITGGHYGVIRNCYNRGTVESTGNDTFGGIAGYAVINQYSSSNLTSALIENTYNIGTMVITNSWGKGAIVGNADNVTTTNCYWLSGCGASYGRSGYSQSNTGAESRTVNQLKQLTSTLGSSFVADTNNINDGYPILHWQAQ